MGDVSRVGITLLCEDSQTDMFVRRFLKHRNFQPRDFDTLPLPHGNQSGEQWVRERYPVELRAIRQVRNAYLIVVTDADGESTETRRAQLEAECERQGVPRRSDDDRVVVIVPRRNIETWLAYIAGSNVNEHDPYPRLKRKRDCAGHARRLFTMCHEAQRLREPVPPSLQEACDEYRRLQR